MPMLKDCSEGNTNYTTCYNPSALLCNLTTLPQLKGLRGWSTVTQYYFPFGTVTQPNLTSLLEQKQYNATCAPRQKQFCVPCALTPRCQEFCTQKNAILIIIIYMPPSMNNVVKDNAKVETFAIYLEKTSMLSIVPFCTLKHIYKQRMKRKS